MGEDFREKRESALWFAWEVFRRVISLVDARMEAVRLCDVV